MRVVVLLGLALLAVAPRTARGDDPPTPPPPTPATETFALENGLRVFIRPTPGASEAFAQVLYEIGERDDPPGRPGLARLMGALYTDCAAGEVVARRDRDADPALVRIEVRDDFTAICRASRPDRFRLVMREAAARMGDLRIEADDVTRVRAEDLVPDPELEARDAAMDLLQPLPGGGRRGGTVPPTGVDLATARERWRRLYKPANAVLVVTGDVDPVLVRTGARRWFGAIPAGERVPAPVASPAVAVPDDPIDLRSPPFSSPMAGLGGLGGRLGRRLGGNLTSEDLQTVLARLAPLVRENLRRLQTRFSLFVEAPAPLSARRLAAALVLQGRLIRGTEARDPAHPDEIHYDRPFERWGAGVRYRPLEDPTLLRITSVPGSRMEYGTVVEDLRRRLKDAASAVRPEDVWTAGWLADHGAFDDLDRAGPCATALSIARRTQLGLDAVAVRAELDRVTVEDLAAIAAGRTVAVVSTPNGP